MGVEGFAGGKAVHLWKCNIEENAGCEHEIFKLLSPDECRRAERYRVEKVRRQFIIARGALRQILGGYLDLAPESLDFEYLKHGKPRLRNENVDRISFNVSHSENICLIAIAKGRRIGVDVESIRSGIDYESIAKRMFSASDTAWLQAAEPNKRLEMFYRLWTRKEAYVKAIGDGVFETANLIGPDLAAWTVTDLQIEDGYAAATAVEGEVNRPELWNWNGVRP